jgi:hypothetical protein
MSAVVNDIFMPLTLSLWKLQPVNPAQQLWILQSPDHTEEAAHHFGWFAHFAGLDCPASSKLTQERLSWRHVQPGLIPDLDGEHYFKYSAAASSM